MCTFDRAEFSDSNHFSALGITFPYRTRDEKRHGEMRI